MKTIRLYLASGLGAVSILHGTITESPVTIPPGRFLLRMDALSLKFDRHDPAQGDRKYTALAVASTILSTGLTENLDVQIGLDLFHRETIDLRGQRDSRSGRGDMRLRAKYTFWRDHTLGAAAAVMPYVKIPSNTGGVGNGSLEGGLIVPWAMGAPGGTTFGAMAEWAVVRNDADDGYDSFWFASALFNRPLAKSVTLYGEATVALTSAGLARSALTIGAGVLWQLTPSLQLDCSVNRGLTHAANDWNPVARLNWEF